MLLNVISWTKLCYSVRKKPLLSSLLHFFVLLQQSGEKTIFQTLPSAARF